MNPNEVCVKLTDFGVSQVVYEPIEGKVVENPVWMAPEISTGKAYNEVSDTYAVGVMFWEIISRDRYFGNLSFTSDVQRRYAASADDNFLD